MRRARPFLSQLRMILALVLALHVFGPAPVSRADGTRSNTPELFYQPAAGMMAGSIETFFSTSPVQESYSSQGAPIYTREVERSGYGARLAYSVTDAWAVHAFARTENQAIKVADPYGSVNQKASGMGDAELRLTNLTALGSWTMQIALGVGFSPEKHTEATRTKEGNINSGGGSVANALGLSTPIASGILFGLKLGDVTQLEKTANSNATGASDYKMVGGNQTITRIFFEGDSSDFEVDLSVGYDFFDPVVNKFPDGSQSTFDAYSVLVVGVGLQAQFLTSFNLRAACESTTFGTRNYPTAGTQTSTYAQSLATLRLRYEL